MSSVEQDHTAVETWVVDRLGEDKLNSLSEDGLETLRSEYREALESYDSEKFAAVEAFRNFNFEKYVTAAAEVEFTTIGGNGPRSFGDQDAVFLFGSAIPDGDPMGAAVILITESDCEDLTLQDLIDEYSEAGQPLSLDVSCRTAEDVPDAYVCEIPEGSTVSECIEETDPAEAPPEGERKDRIRKVTEEVDVINVGENLSMVDENDYPADFGVDLKRVEPVSITSSQVTSGGARYELQDDSFLDAEMELDETITGTEDKSAGLVGWAESDVMALETGSMCEAVYGTVKVNDDGQIQLSIAGYEPKNVTEAEIRDTSDSGGSGGSTDNASGDSIEETTI